MSDSSTEVAWRRTTATVLLVLLFIAAAGANYALWLQTTISNSQSFADAFEPLPQDAAVAQLLGRSIANAAVDTEQVASSLSTELPDRLEPLAVPIANALNQVAERAAVRVIEVDQFEAVWGRTLEATHTALVDFLKLRSEVQVLLVDVSEAADQLADRLVSLGIDFETAENPRIALIQAHQEPAIVTALRFVYSSGWIFPVIYLVLVAAVVFLRVDRRKAVVSVGFVTALAMTFDLILSRILRGTISDRASDSLAEQALRQAWDTVTSRLRWQTWIVLIAGLAVAGIARYTGDDARDGTVSRSMDQFLVHWGTLTQGLVIALALLVLLVAPSMTVGLAFLVAGLAGLIVVFIHIRKESAQPAADVAAESQIETSGSDITPNG